MRGCPRQERSDAEWGVDVFFVAGPTREITNARPQRRVSKTHHVDGIPFVASCRLNLDALAERKRKRLALRPLPAAAKVCPPRAMTIITTIECVSDVCDM